MYTHDYVEWDEGRQFPVADLERHLQIILAAQKLALPALAELATLKAEQRVDATISSFHSFKHIECFIDDLLVYKNKKTQVLSFRKLLEEVKGFGTDFKVALFEGRDATMRKHRCLLCNKNFWTEVGIQEKIHCPYCKRNGGVAQVGAIK